ncbi:MAG: SAM-dependent DNA methyltransferase, partial [Ectothiorhodospiraceae bacterium AqS1]|nr:SAM-dependent DNA methyltransferase [Ectothiorhodospiraceae bacterium AqS1]
MQTLATELRRQLRQTVVEARDIAEIGARKALKALAVPHHEPYGHLTCEQRVLRKRLRAHARHLGDGVDARTGTHSIDHLVHECAYEHWHGMLFARFLAENHLLIEPDTMISITLAECEDLAKEEGIDKWALAARFAHRMLPQVFRPDHPLFDVKFAREHRLILEGLLDALPAEVFTATDSLGWVYQFWQTRKKDEVNRSEGKIGADELSAVTQLFTEPYMVRFLLHNSLGAWWADRHPDKTCPVNLSHLRRSEDGMPAAGVFEGWPECLSKFRLLDPCCGSGHFLVAAFLMLVPMRMALERLNAADAVDAVLRENIHGLELDRRCVAIAAFALALEAWRFPDAGGFRRLPKLDLAWCGQPVVGKKDEWLALAEGDSRLEVAMELLYDTFRDAPVLGSLIDPARSISKDVLTAGFEDMRPLLESALRDQAGNEEWGETAIAASGLADTARMLAGTYHAVLTNVPYLGREKHTPRLRAFCETNHPLSKHDLATVFLERILTLCGTVGDAILVLPQYWLFLARYRGFREKLLKKRKWRLLATLGPRAFEAITGEVVNTCLAFIGSSQPSSDDRGFSWIDASKGKDRGGKEALLSAKTMLTLSQAEQLANPDSVIGYQVDQSLPLLESVAYCHQGLATSDNAQFVFNFWELPRLVGGWEPFQFAPESTAQVSGCSHILLWDDGCGRYARHAKALKEEGRLGGWKSGHGAWGSRGIAINRMGDLPVSLYFGTKFDCNVAVLVPNERQDIPSIWEYCKSPEYAKSVRNLNSKLSVTNATLAKVPYDSSRWNKQKPVRTKDIFGLETTDPTQWAFHGNPRHSLAPLQTGVARLLGYRWPIETGLDVELSQNAEIWFRQAKDWAHSQTTMESYA